METLAQMLEDYRNGERGLPSYEELCGLTAATVQAQEPRPDLIVWYGAMPESNGRSNFTATLMRKGASVFDTSNYTFQRSEYPDRTRYEADCMRYLIGELAEEPSILDYDADKHSGYVAPAAQGDAKEQSC